MKRFLLLAGAAALCTLAFFALYCADVKFDNPLDEKEKGKNEDAWLWEIKEGDCAEHDIFVPAGQKYTSCVDYIRNNYLTADPDTKNEWKSKLGGCVGQDEFTIEVVGPSPVTLYHNHPSSDMGVGGFDKWMGRNGWDGVVKYTGGVTPEAVITTNGTDPLPNQQQMPSPRETPYVIQYKATKKKCGSDDFLPVKSETRHLLVLPYTADDTVRPSIVLTGCQNTYIQGQVILNVHACVSPGGGARLEQPVIRSNGAVVDSVRTTAPAVFDIAYRACKTLIHGGVSDPSPTCVDTTRRVTVTEDTKPSNDLPAVIVFNKYSYNVDGTPFSSPDTAFRIGGTFAEPGQGAVSAYYIDKDGAKQNIPVTVNGNLARTHNIPLGPNDLRPLETGYPVTYTLEADAGKYAKTTATRIVYLNTQGYCEGTPTWRPRFRRQTATGGWENVPTGEDATINIPSNTPWSNFQSSIRITGEDSDGYPVNVYTLSVIGTPKLDLDNPQSGTYTITYILVTECSGDALTFSKSPERTVVVK